MKRAIVGVLIGLIVWFAIATVINLAFRMAWHGYREAEIPMTFTLAMLLGRLGLGALSSLGAGFAAARIAKGFGTPVKVLSVLLLLLFIPIHYGLWDKFPIWYHLAFLASLIPLTLLGALCNAQSTAPPTR